MLNENRERRVAIYARVSTEHEAQLSALENQKDWYKPIMEQNPQWKLVRMYIDEGITGTSAKKRPRFMQMVQDAEIGDFDLILTREVSRFARNTVDTLQYTRQLKAIGVEVYFINDNIKTFDGDGELRLTIMATLAQDESRKTSIRVKSGQKTSMENGVFYGTGNILGYDRVGSEMVINPEQAKTVRMIYDWYIEGNGIKKIQYMLEQNGRKTATGKDRWYMTTISHVLRNPFYCGRIVYRKQYVPDYLEQKKINNYGEVDQIVVKGRHEPIVTENEFEHVQQILESKRQSSENLIVGKHGYPSGKKPPRDVWSKLLKCQCGCSFNRKKWHTTEFGTQYGYQCYSSLRTGTVKSRQNKGLSTDGICTSPMVPGWKLQMMARFVFQNYVNNVDEIISLSIGLIEEGFKNKRDDDKKYSDIECKKKEIAKLSNKLDTFIEMRADGEITKEVFLQKKNNIEKEIRTLKKEITDIENNIDEEHNDIPLVEKLEKLKDALYSYVDFDSNDDIPGKVIDAFVEKIVVYDDKFEWYLRFLDSDKTVMIGVNGKRKNKAVVSFFSDMPHRQQLAKEGNELFSFVINLHQAKEYLYKYSTRRRVYKWEDLFVHVYL